jgi:hypothetical protein
VLPEQNEIKLIELFKVCSKCKIPKTLKGFTKELKGRFGVRGDCKKCVALRCNSYHKIHKKERNLYGRIYHQEHKEEICIRHRRNWVNASKETVLKIYAQNKTWRKANKAKMQTWHKDYHKKKWKTDPKFRLKSNITRVINLSLKDGKNGKHWENLVGYTLTRLIKHLEKQFTEGMAWNNYGMYGWVVDHKIPISAFNFTQPEHRDFQRCWALKNLQPMWSRKNIIKSNKLSNHFQPSLLM